MITYLDYFRFYRTRSSSLFPSYDESQTNEQRSASFGGSFRYLRGDREREIDGEEAELTIRRFHNRDRQPAQHPLHDLARVPLQPLPLVRQLLEDHLFFQLVAHENGHVGETGDGKAGGVDEEGVRFFEDSVVDLQRKEGERDARGGDQEFVGTRTRRRGQAEKGVRDLAESNPSSAIDETETKAKEISYKARFKSPRERRDTSPPKKTTHLEHPISDTLREIISHRVRSLHLSSLPTRAREMILRVDVLENERVETRPSGRGHLEEDGREGAGFHVDVTPDTTEDFDLELDGVEVGV